MSTPIYDKKKQLLHIKDKLHLISYMVDQLTVQVNEVELKDFIAIENELNEVLEKTRLFRYRNERMENKMKG